MMVVQRRKERIGCLTSSGISPFATFEGSTMFSDITIFSARMAAHGSSMEVSTAKPYVVLRSCKIRLTPSEHF